MAQSPVSLPRWELPRCRGSLNFKEVTLPMLGSSGLQSTLFLSGTNLRCTLLSRVDGSLRRLLQVFKYASSIRASVQVLNSRTLPCQTTNRLKCKEACIRKFVEGVMTVSY
jgi:hypothetical protein